MPLHHLPASVRHVKAQLRPLTRPAVWSSAIVLVAMVWFAWEAWRNPDILTKFDFSEDFGGGNSELSGEYDAEERAIAADIDSSDVLQQLLSEQEANPGAISPPPSAEQNEKLFEQLQKSRSQTSAIDSLLDSSSNGSDSSSPDLPSLQLEQSNSVDLFANFMPQDNQGNEASDTSIEGWLDNNFLATETQESEDSDAQMSPLQRYLLESARTSNSGTSANSTNNSFGNSLGRPPAPTASQAENSANSLPNGGVSPYAYPGNNPNAQSPNAGNETGIAPYGSNNPNAYPNPYASPNGTTPQTAPIAPNVAPNNPSFLPNPDGTTNNSNNFNPNYGVPTPNSAGTSSPNAPQQLNRQTPNSQFPNNALPNPNYQQFPNNNSPTALPRRVPGRHIGNGEINTFSNP